MRHKHNKLIELTTGQHQTRSNLIRTLLTNLVRTGELTTTSKRAKVLKSEADKFFARLVRLFDMYADEKDVRREAIRIVKSTIFSDAEGKKVVDELLPKYRAAGKKAGFVADYKLGYRMGDGAEKILVRLI